MLRNNYSSSVSWLAAAVNVLNSQDLDGSKLLADAGIRVEDYNRWERRAPTEIIRKAWRIVSTTTSDPAIGIRAAFNHFNPADWQSLGLAILCSRTLRQALERLVRYFELVSNAIDFRMTLRR